MRNVKHDNGALMQSRGDVLPKDFTAAVKDIKLAILQLRDPVAGSSRHPVKGRNQGPESGAQKGPRRH